MAYAHIPLNIGLCLSVGWVLISLWLSSNIGLFASYTALAGFGLARMLQVMQGREAAAVVWLLSTNLAIFIGSFSVHPDGHLIFMLTMTAGLPLMVFAWSERLRLALVLSAVSPAVWLLRHTIGTPPGHIYEVGPELARNIYAPIVAATIFATIIFQVGFFAVIAQRYARKLERARVEAEQASRAKAAFLSGISHEMRTPLNGVIGLAGLLALDRRVAEDKRLAGYVTGIETSGRELLRIVETTVAFSEIAGQNRVAPQVAVPLAPLVAALVAAHRDRAHAAGITLRVAIDRDARVLADAALLSEVLTLLLDNALRYAGAETRVTIGTAPVRTGWLRLCVTDTGPGFATTDPDQAFAPFERLDRAGSTSLGAGMGLAVARLKTTAMGGRIGITPGRTSGAEVWIDLPLPPADAPGAAQTADQSPVSGMRAISSST